MKNPFIPHRLPINDLNFSKLIKLVSEASNALARYNGVLSNIVNPSLLLTTLATKEAVLSSRIEGTQASFIDVLEKDLKKYDDNKKLDIEEVENCKKALEYGVAELKNKPICLNLIKQMHSILLDSVRGYNKDRGSFRKIQNFIGFEGAKIEQAYYIPPSSDPLDNVMMNALTEWEKYIHLESEETLIQLAIMHAQFEIIHPFLDGNGRIGRILIPLFLHDKKYIDFPAFYMSEYLESHRSEYYVRLRNISDNNDWQGWIEFFLRAIIKQSHISLYRASQIVYLYNFMKDSPDMRVSTYHFNDIINFIFKKPVFTALDLCNMDEIATLKPSKSTIIRALDKMSSETYSHSSIADGKQLIHKTNGSGAKPTTYRFTALLNIIENKN